MSFFSRVFKRPPPAVPIETPDDDHLTARLNSAKNANTAAVANFIEASLKQERDAEFARTVIQQVLSRVEQAKAGRHATHITK